MIVGGQGSRRSVSWVDNSRCTGDESAQGAGAIRARRDRSCRGNRGGGGVCDSAKIHDSDRS